MAGRATLISVSLVFLVSVCPVEAATPAVSISSGGVSSDRDNNGWRFQALSDIEVVSLGAWDEGEDGFPMSVAVGLWTDGGVLLDMVTLPAGTGATLDNGFRYGALNNPVALDAGQFYRVASTPTSGDLEFRVDVSLVSAQEIGFDSGYFSTTDNVLTFPDQQSPFPAVPDFFGANFQYVPEPSSSFFLLIGALGFFMRRCP
ncbi:MAG: PEP-CTERM sorting domain-containing protein [Verrucomicrobiota bacterium]